MSDKTWRRAKGTEDRPNAVEVTGTQSGGVLFREPRGGQNAVLYYSREEWLTFLSAVKAGEFDDLG